MPWTGQVRISHDSDVESAVNNFTNSRDKA
jgi:hypothetical protein